VAALEAPEGYPLTFGSLPFAGAVDDEETAVEQQVDRQETAENLGHGGWVFLDKPRTAEFAYPAL
jgi:hypothetical protein